MSTSQYGLVCWQAYKRECWQGRLDRNSCSLCEYACTLFYRYPHHIILIRDLYSSPKHTGLYSQNEYLTTSLFLRDWEGGHFKRKAWLRKFPHIIRQKIPGHFTSWNHYQLDLFLMPSWIFLMLADLVNYIMNHKPTPRLDLVFAFVRYRT